jgi:hypothetical protein
MIETVLRKTLYCEDHLGYILMTSPQTSRSDSVVWPWFIVSLWFRYQFIDFLQVFGLEE